MAGRTGRIVVNKTSDHAAFLMHGVANAALLAGVTVAVANPYISAAAAALTLAVRYGVQPYIKNAFSKALPSRETDATVNDLPAHRSPSLQSKLRSAFNNAAEYSRAMGLTPSPSFHFLDGREPVPVAKQKRSLADSFREFLQTKINKSANAFAFAHRSSAVVLTKPLAEKLDSREVNAVVGHEVGHIAARHSLKTGLMAMMAMPARLTAGIFSLVVMFSSLKNFGLVILSDYIGGVLARGYARLRGLDYANEAKPRHVAEFARARGLAQKVMQIGAGLTFAAPDLALAGGLSLATGEVANLLAKSQSRAHEYQADRLAAEATRDPMALASGLDKVRRYNIAYEKGMESGGADGRQPQGSLSGIFNRIRSLYLTHPGNDQRRAQLEKLSLALG